MKNEALDLLVLTAVQSGAKFQRTIMEHLIGAVSPPLKKLEVENSLRRLKAAGKVSYEGQVKGWQVAQAERPVSALN